MHQKTKKKLDKDRLSTFGNILQPVSRFTSAQGFTSSVVMADQGALQVGWAPVGFYLSIDLYIYPSLCPSANGTKRCL